MSRDRDTPNGGDEVVSVLRDSAVTVAFPADDLAEFAEDAMSQGAAQTDDASISPADFDTSPALEQALLSQRQLDEAGDTAVTRDRWTALVARTETYLAPDDPFRIRIRMGQLIWLAEEDDDPEAAVAGLGDLARVIDAWPVIHPLAIAVRRSLGWWRTQAGATTQGMAALTALVTSLTAALPSTHPDLVETERVLAVAHGELANPQEAVQRLRNLLDRLSPFGDETVLEEIRVNLAYWQSQVRD
ncbi:MAG: hypothetical protein ACK5LS_13860 [Propioniciclava sp.]